MESDKKSLVFNILVFIVGVTLGGLVVYYNQKTISIRDISPIREQSSAYKFIHPLLAYDFPQTDQDEYSSLKGTLNSLLEKKLAQKKISTASVYFRDLTKGRWIGINEEETYAPASLLKVALMIGYFKSSETGAVNLTDTLVYKSKGLSPFETPSQLIENQSYSLDDLIKYLITKSDNGAKDLLLANIDSKLLNSVYTSIGIKHPSETAGYEISAKNYALFLRVLYNATFLNREFSEKALELLSQVEFKEGLVAGVADNIIISHKFGEKVNDDGKGNVVDSEFHDCGIFYTQSGDYLLCVMTKGNDKKELIQTIKAVSEAVYLDKKKK